MPENLTLPVVLPDGTRMFVEARAIGGVQKTSDSRVEQEFSRVLELLERVGASVSATLARLTAAKASAEFGLEIAVEGGQLTALIAKGSASTSLKVTLEWTGRQLSGPDPKG
jgi:hypothetical protein